jgi:multidrug efflux pump subunit AcrA (membrane-fusion protein)
MKAQSQVSTDQQTVSTDEAALAKLLASDATSVKTPSHTPATTGSASSGTSSGVTGKAAGGPSTNSATAGAGGSGKSSGTAGSSSGTASGATPTVTNSAAQLATDQATIDSAAAGLVVAEQSLGAAQLTTPITGTVASIGVSTGESVTPNSTTNAITVINTSGYQTTSSLTSTQVSQVAVGDQVQVSVNGSSGTIAGTVSRVGPVSVSSSSDSYPVIVALDTGGSTMSAGSTADVKVDVAKATNALVVPTSAVHTAGSGRSYVIVLQSGAQKQTRVSVGAVGDVYTQIKSGLVQGQTVVLADPSQALPSSNTNSTGGFPGGVGGFPGAAGGFPGGGARTGGATAVGG